MLSIIIPFHNEEENLVILYQELETALNKKGYDYEVVFVNDGSTDKSGQMVDELAKNNNRIIVVHLQKRSGKGNALVGGINKAHGDILVFMDADLQDNPADITKLIGKINQDYDLVNGIRTTRKDSSIIKTYSRLANAFLKFFSQSPFTDINCGFKALKRNVLDEIVLYGNNFRFLPLAAFYQGFKVSEVPVDNRERRHGQSKFGAGKLFIGVFDTITASFLYRFAEKPLHFFGTIGGALFVTGFIIAFVLSIQRLFFNVLLYQRPALLFAILLIIVGLQIVMTGIIGELIVYINKKKS
jgi:glycosyltransferase involved in cell wall biosynthesis